jgi:hypothetical protein
MKVLYIRLARAIWLVDSRELNPHGIDIFPVVEAIKNRYSFQSYPTKPEEMNEFDPKGIVFMNGSFAAGTGQRHTIVKATIYGDGIVVDSALSTDFCESVLADALGFLSDQFGFTYRPNMVHKKLHVSEMIVQTDKDLLRLFDPLNTVWKKLHELTGMPFQPLGFGFGIDPEAPGAKRVAFTFEREVGKPFSQGRYFSSAPLQTDRHENMLQQLEGLL